MDGKITTGPPVGMSVVLQEYGRSLFPWLTVEANVMLAVEKAIRDSRQRRSAVKESLDRVGLGEVGSLYPWQLSGGMQQRVAIARALVVDPVLLVMDEPFASVDAQTRIELEDLLLSLWQDANMTVVFVTHDIDEAAYLSDRVLVLSQRPSRVQDQIRVDLPRPRDQVTTKSLTEYLSIRSKILQEVRGKGCDEALSTSSEGPTRSDLPGQMVAVKAADS
jgi:NitT/TauT family transport system ATP-binding protein